MAEAVIVSNDSLPVNHNIIDGETDADANVVLLTLDDAIETAAEEFRIPEVRPEDVAPPVKLNDIVLSFKWPLTALAVVGASATGVIWTAVPVLYMYFPYYALVVNFAGGIPSTKESLDSMADAIIPRLEAAELNVQSAAYTVRNKASNGYSSYTNFLHRKGHETVHSVKGMIGSQADPREATSALQSYDVSDDSIRKNLDTEGVVGGNATVNQQEGAYTNASVLRGSRFVCLAFQSKELFTFFVTVPILAVSFLVELILVWYMQQIIGFSPAKGTDAGIMVIRRKWSPLFYSLQTFSFVVVQMILAFWASKASRVAQIINTRVQNRAKHVAFYKKHLSNCMVYIKQKLIQLMKFLSNILRIKDFGRSMMEQFAAPSMAMPRWNNAQIGGEPNATDIT